MADVRLRAWSVRVAIAAGALMVLACAALSAQGSYEKAYVAMLGVVLAPVAAVVALRTPPSVTITAGLALSVFSGYWDQLGSPIGLDRLVLAAGIFVVFVRALDDDRWRPPIRGVHWLLLVVSVYAAGSALWADTLASHDGLFALLDRLGFTSFALFLIAPCAFATERDRDNLLIGLVVLGAYLAFVTLAQGLGLDGLVFPKYILDPSIGYHADRARGPFVEAAANGLALYANAAASAMASMRWRGRSTVAARCALAVSFACLIAILFTLTRQAWLAATVATLVTLLWHPRLRRYLIPVLATGVIAVVGALALVPSLRVEVTTRAESRQPVWDRLNSNRAGLAMVLANPLTGIGWSRYAEEADDYYTLAANYPLTTVGTLHNVFLSNAAELGLPMALLWAAALLWALGAGLTGRGPPEADLWRTGLLAFAVAWLIVSNFTPLGYASSNYLLWTWAGVAWVASRPALVLGLRQRR